MTDIRQRLGRLPLDRRVRFVKLLESGQPDGVADRPTPRQRADNAPLSYAQDLLWFLDRQFPGMSAYNLVSAIWLRGKLDAEALNSALASVVGRHETLRTSFRELPTGPVQVIAPSIPVRMPVTTVDGSDPEARRAAARESAESIALRPFDLTEGPLWRAALYRTTEEEHLFVWIVHHSIFDGSASELFARELAELYGAAIDGRAPSLPELPLQYADFAIWQRERLTGKRLDKLLAYWRDKLREPPLLELPTDRPRPAEFTFKGADSWLPIDAELVTNAHRLANTLGVTPYPVYVAAFVVLLHRYSRQDDLIVGCSTSIRGLLELENLLGFFVNMMALRVNAGGDPTFRDLVGHVSQVVREAFAHVDLPFERVVQAVSPVRDPSRPSPLVQVNFLLPEQPKQLNMHGLEVDFEYPAARSSKFDMTWQVYEAGDESAIYAEYSTDLFDAKTIARMQGQFAQLLAGLIADPDQPISRPGLLPPAERDELINRWNGPERELPTATIDRMFAEQAALRGDAVAVVAGDDRISYAELDERANRFAWLLREHGVDTGKRVALCLPRGIDYVVGVLGTLQAGGAFVPFDSTSPPDRLAGLVDDCDPHVVVTTSAVRSSFPDDGRTVLAFDNIAETLAAQPADRLVATSRLEDAAYILYTSGSTGTPKGVVVEHSCVVNFVRAIQELFDLTPVDNVLAYASYTFDVSVGEMFDALLTGARLHVALDKERLDVDRLQQLVKDAEISVIDMPPSVMALLDPSEFDKLRIAFVGGEPFSGELVNRWNKVARFFNGYGPTECTVTMIVHECDGHWDGSPPIGLPIANHVAHVLDENLEPLPYGVPGELVIGGSGLASGYLNRPELTREKFIPDPFGTTPGGRLYRTGDLVKRRPDGALVFLGRVDRQIKIRGVRIEPGEIEAVLAIQPGVRQTYVEAPTNSRGDRPLVAYVGAPAEQKPEAEELRAKLAEKLPAVMVPQHIMVLDELPLTSSGKVDTKRLPAVTSPTKPKAELTAPRSETEQTIAESFFEPALKSTAVDVLTSFFELGGNSLQAAQLLSAIRRKFEVEISVADFFRDPTVAGMALVVDRQRATNLDDDDLLTMIEQMSDEEVERMLGSDGVGRNP